MTVTRGPDSSVTHGLAANIDALRTPNIALLVSGTVMNSAGNIVYNIGIAWLAYQLTNSALIVGSLNSMRTLPILLLGPFIGVLLDRTHRPTVLKCNAAFVALLSAGFLTLLLSGGLETWHLYVYMLLVGVGFAVGVSARRAVYADSVDSRLLLNALSLDLLGFEVVRIAAPALVGLVVALWGVPAAFAGQLALYTAVFFALLPVRAKSHDIRSVSQHSPLHNLREGLTYAAHQPTVAASLLLSLVVFLVGPDIFFFVLPVYVRDTLHLGAEGVGLLGSASAVGGIFGGLVASSLGHRYGKGALLPAALTVMALSMLGLAASSWLPLALLCAAGMGAGLVAFRALNEASIQQVLDPALRGRISTLSFMMMGAGTFAGVGSGALSHAYGAPLTIALGGALLLGTAGFLLVRKPAGLRVV